MYRQIGQALSGDHPYKVVVLRSTVLPGTLGEVLVPLLEEASGHRLGEWLGVATNPEFLREGSAIRDFRNPPFTLIGSQDDRAGERVALLYEGISAPIHHTDPDAACMVKYVCNAFHALKVTFANEVGRLGKRLGIDSREIMELVCRDTKLNISPAYLRPGFAFGGSCLPKDLRALLHLARHQDLDLPLLESILPSNQLQIQHALELIGQRGPRRVGIIGLCFKPETDDLRESPMVALVETLIGKGLQVRIYDEILQPARLTGSNKAFIDRSIEHLSDLMCASLREATENVEVVVVGHAPLDGCERLEHLLEPDQLVIDLVKAIPEGSGCRATVQGICW